MIQKDTLTCAGLLGLAVAVVIGLLAYFALGYMNINKMTRLIVALVIAVLVGGGIGAGDYYEGWLGSKIGSCKAPASS